MPKALKNKPELFDSLIVVWEAFLILSSCRQAGFSPQPIQLTEIKSYFELYGKPDDIAEFIEYLKYLDEQYLILVSKNDRHSN